MFVTLLSAWYLVWDPPRPSLWNPRRRYSRQSVDPGDGMVTASKCMDFCQQVFSVASWKYCWLEVISNEGILMKFQTSFRHFRKIFRHYWNSEKMITMIFDNSDYLAAVLMTCVGFLHIVHRFYLFLASTQFHELSHNWFATLNISVHDTRLFQSLSSYHAFNTFWRYESKVRIKFKLKCVIFFDDI